MKCIIFYPDKYIKLNGFILDPIVFEDTQHVWRGVALPTQISNEIVIWTPREST